MPRTGLRGVELVRVPQAAHEAFLPLLRLVALPSVGAHLVLNVLDVDAEALLRTPVYCLRGIMCAFKVKHWYFASHAK